MGRFVFRRRVKIAKGVYLNLGKKKSSVSFRILPGLSYRHDLKPEKPKYATFTEPKPRSTWFLPTFLILIGLAVVAAAILLALPPPTNIATLAQPITTPTPGLSAIDKPSAYDRCTIAAEGEYPAGYALRAKSPYTSDHVIIDGHLYKTDGWADLSTATESLRINWTCSAYWSDQDRRIHAINVEIQQGTAIPVPTNTPPPSPTPPPMTKLLQDGNLREKPGLEFDIRRQLKAGTPVRLDTLANGTNGEKWFYVYDGAGYGWISSSLVDISPEAMAFIPFDPLVYVTPTPHVADRPTQVLPTEIPLPPVDVPPPAPSGVRTGAICRDGTRSTATGSGACSRHGGVAQWLYGP